MDTEILSGYLKKRNSTGLLRGWSKRWFGISKHCFFYFKTCRDTSPSSTFAIEDLVGIKRMGGNEFEVAFQDKALILKGDSGEEVDRWLEAFHAVVEIKNLDVDMSPLASKKPSHHQHRNYSPTSPLQTGNLNPLDVGDDDQRDGGPGRTGGVRCVSRGGGHDGSPPSPRSMLANPAAVRGTAFGGFFSSDDTFESLPEHCRWKEETREETTIETFDFQEEGETELLPNVEVYTTTRNASLGSGGAVNHNARSSYNPRCDWSNSRAEVDDANWAEESWDDDDESVEEETHYHTTTPSSQQSLPVPHRRVLDSSTHNKHPAARQPQAQSRSHREHQRVVGSLLHKHQESYPATHAYGAVQPDNGWLEDDFDSD